MKPSVQLDSEVSVFSVVTCLWFRGLLVAVQKPITTFAAYTAHHRIHTGDSRVCCRPLLASR